MSAGYLIVDYGGPRQEYDTGMCVHCGLPFVIAVGSRRKRHVCRLCNGPTCIAEDGAGGIVGNRRCLECYPIERKLDDVESGKLPLSAL
jgi:hypothetical protein